MNCKLFCVGKKKENKILFEQLFENKYLQSISWSVKSQDNIKQPLSIVPIKNFGKFEFDVFDVLINKSIFVDIFMAAIDNSNLIYTLKLSRVNLLNFANAVTDIYYDMHNPYHNIHHAIHVFHSVFVLFQLPEIYKIIIQNPILAFATYIATFCHDIDHCGSTNRFLVATNNMKAIKYNGISPQEMHHSSITMNLLDKYKVLENSKIEKYNISFKEYIVKIILATNINDHNLLMNSFSIKSPLKCMKLILKCADLSHVFAKEESHIKWVSMLQNEFYIQGDREKYYKLPVTAMFDREHPENMNNSQSDFFKIIVIPMFNLLFKSFPSTSKTSIANLIHHNYHYWQNHHE